MKWLARGYWANQWQSYELKRHLLKSKHHLPSRRKAICGNACLLVDRSKRPYRGFFFHGLSPDLQTHSLYVILVILWDRIWAKLDPDLNCLRLHCLVPSSLWVEMRMGATWRCHGTSQGLGGGGQKCCSWIAVKHHCLALYCLSLRLASGERHFFLLPELSSALCLATLQSGKSAVILYNPFPVDQDWRARQSPWCFPIKLLLLSKVIPSLSVSDASAVWSHQTGDERSTWQGVSHWLWVQVRRWRIWDVGPYEATYVLLTCHHTIFSSAVMPALWQHSKASSELIALL